MISLFSKKDKNGEIILPFEFDEICSYAISRNFICVKKISGYGFINRNGKKIIPFEYDFDKIYDPSINSHQYLNSFIYGFFREDFVLLKKDNKYGFLDKKGKIIIPFLYDEALNFSEGFAPVRLNGKRFWIDKEGNRAL